MSLLLLMDDAFSPRSLFAAGEQGFWYDSSDFTTMFQDADGTTPVTAVGQSVGRINDKSGRGNHATQATAASRPTLQQDSTGRYYLSFDGTDDGMVTNSINFTGTNKMTVWAGVRKLSDAAAGVVAELSETANSNNGSFFLLAPNTAETYALRSRGTIVSLATSPATFAAPTTNVLTGICDISGDSAILRIDGAQVASDVADQGTGNYGNYPLYIGRRGGTSNPFNGRIYQLIGRGAATPLAQLVAMERYVNSKTGAY